MQWYGSLLPRIHAFLPTVTLLEIAPGYGRWTQYLKDLCQQLIVVDLSEKCIAACQERFADCSNISYAVNDGLSLDMVPDESIDFVFSFDSLVHAEKNVFDAYLPQLRFKLKKNGVGFIHHSNMGEYASYYKNAQDRAPKNLQILGIERVFPGWRAHTMSAETFAKVAGAAALQCINQELINWVDIPQLIDCMSLFTRIDSMWARPNRISQNGDFMKEAQRVAKLAASYSRASFSQEV